jgi:RimJ/RimL family protein N-acetyltransferase
MRLEFGGVDHGRTIARAAGTAFNPDVDMVIASLRDDRLLGGLVYQAYTGVEGSISVHMASFDPRWANRYFLWVGFHYPFEQLHCKKMFAQVPANNAKALSIDLKLGFKEEIRVPGVFPDADLIVLSMSRDQCPWLGIRS